jgi:anti-sigma B factor antagonist
MKLQIDGETLRISDVKELGAANANSFRDRARAALSEGQRHIEVDLSQTSLLDSCGLGALVALHKTACGRQGGLRVLNPTPSVQQILELTQLHRVLEVVKQ